MAEQPVQGTFIWHEINTPDAEGARKFYTELVGWESNTMEMGPGQTYTMFQNGGSDVGGIVAMEGEQWKGVPPHWMIYIAVDDVDAACEKVKQLGGAVRVEPMDIPVGRLAVLTDPAGASFSVLKLKG
ncbi:MAG: VOC family protein [SAR324 cluster bacterium]|nr:VOC family protein [SAR324 cluster bacterium]